MQLRRGGKGGGGGGGGGAGGDSWWFDFGCILWQILCLAKLMIRVCFGGAQMNHQLPSCHLTCFAPPPVFFSPSRSNKFSSQKSKYSGGKKKMRTCHRSDNEWQRSPDTMATRGIQLNGARDESGPWCSLRTAGRGRSSMELSQIRSGSKALYKTWNLIAGVGIILTLAVVNQRLNL